MIEATLSRVGSNSLKLAAGLNLGIHACAASLEIFAFGAVDLLGPHEQRQACCCIERVDDVSKGRQMLTPDIQLAQEFGTAVGRIVRESLVLNFISKNFLLLQGVCDIAER